MGGFAGIQGLFRPITRQLNSGDRLVPWYAIRPRLCQVDAGPFRWCWVYLSPEGKREFVAGSTAVASPGPVSCHEPAHPLGGPAHAASPIASSSLLFQACLAL